MSGYSPFVFGSPPQAVAQGQTLPLDSALLASAFRAPVYIDEVRFAYIRYLPDSVGAALGGSLRVRMALGRYEVTQARNSPFVPMWNFAPRSQVSAETQQGMYRWRLPKPLFVPAGAMLSTSIYRTVDGDNGTVLVAVAYAGRFIPPGTPPPRSIDVPFVSLYEGTAGAGTGMSSELDLVNPFQEPLFVQRFICRVQESNAMDDLGTAEMKITDSRGQAITNNFGDRYDLFDPTKRATVTPSVLGPRERFNVQLQNVGGTSTPMVSMVGWRKEHV